MSKQHTPAPPADQAAEGQEAPPPARVYDPAANPEGAWMPGVPRRDITAAEWAALPAWLQASADATGWYTAPAEEK